MAATTTERVDYSEYGGVYNEEFKRWEWANDEGKFHREGGKPALIFDNGTEIWCEDGVPHRLSGKAWIVKDGSGADAWFLNGNRCNTEDQFVCKRDAYCEKHGISITGGRLTKGANSR